LARPSCGLPLPRFYFHIISTNSFIDDEGINLEDDQDAMRHARQMAGQLVQGMGPLTGAIVVESEDDGRMFEVPLSSWSN
jgi:hypothetical protein